MIRAAKLASFSLILIFTLGTPGHPIVKNKLTRTIGQSKPYRSPFRYIILSNDVRNDGIGPNDTQRSISVLLDAKAFSESTLAQLFQLLSKRYPNPSWLNIWVYTSLEQFSTPEEKESNVEISESDSDRAPDQYYWALYIRSVKGDELYRYNPKLRTGNIKTVVISRKRS